MRFGLELLARFELATSSLPRMRSTDWAIAAFRRQLCYYISGFSKCQALFEKIWLFCQSFFQTCFVPQDGVIYPMPGSVIAGIPKKQWRFVAWHFQNQLEKSCGVLLADFPPGAVVFLQVLIVFQSVNGVPAIDVGKGQAQCFSLCGAHIASCGKIWPQLADTKQNQADFFRGRIVPADKWIAAFAGDVDALHQTGGQGILWKCCSAARKMKKHDQNQENYQALFHYIPPKTAFCYYFAWRFPEYQG